MNGASASRASRLVLGRASTTTVLLCMPSYAEAGLYRRRMMSMWAAVSAVGRHANFEWSIYSYIVLRSCPIHINKNFPRDGSQSSHQTSGFGSPIKGRIQSLTQTPPFLFIGVCMSVCLYYFKTYAPSSAQPSRRSAIKAPPLPPRARPKILARRLGRLGSLAGLVYYPTGGGYGVFMSMWLLPDTHPVIGWVSGYPGMGILHIPYNVGISIFLHMTRRNAQPVPP